MLGDPNRPLLEVDVLHLQAEQLALSQPRGSCQQEQGAVPPGRLHEGRHDGYGERDDLLPVHNAAAAAPRPTRTELRAAAAAFNRANRSTIRGQHQQAHALRTAGRELVRALTDEDGSAFVALLCTAILVIQVLEHWHQTRGHQQQAAAAQQSLTHLQTAYEHAAQPVITQLALRTPSSPETQRLADAVRATAPEHADRILTDPGWPALATVLAQAESAGQAPRRILADAAQQRELGTADRPAEVLLWRIRNTTADHITARAQVALTRSARSISTRTATPAHATPPGHQPTDGRTRRR